MKFCICTNVVNDPSWYRNSLQISVAVTGADKCTKQVQQKPWSNLLLPKAYKAVNNVILQKEGRKEVNDGRRKEGREDEMKKDRKNQGGAIKKKEVTYSQAHPSSSS